MEEQARQRALALDFWAGPVTARALPGGLSNRNFLIDDGSEKYVVRIGDDRPEHAVFRYNEIAVSQAAHEAGLSPALLHHEPGALVFEYLDAAAMTAAADLGRDANMDRLIGLLGQCHMDLSGHLEAPGPMFWVFNQNRRYARISMQHGGRMAATLTRLMDLNDELESAVGSIRPVFCHNDLAGENILDDGRRFWLIDWEYGGWNDGLYDLASLAVNLELDAEVADELLHRYRRLNATGTNRDSRRKFRAWQCAALLWAGLWSDISEMFAELDFDYAEYGQQCLDRLDRAMAEFRRI